MFNAEVLAAAERSFFYLCAERLGPRDVMEAIPVNLSDLDLGTRGEGVAQVLATLDNTPVHPDLAHSGTKVAGARLNLKDQVDLWMSEIVCPIQIKAQWITDTNVASLRFKNPGFLSEWIRPCNTGFGLSYALPIVVAGLSTRPGGILIVENPEAHLHPRGQALIGDFLCRVAKCGVQIVLETHSDHVLNGIRRSVAVGKNLEPADVKILFFATRPFEQEAKTDFTHKAIALNEKGELSEWPKGFFDQIEADLGAIARVRKGS